MSKSTKLLTIFLSILFLGFTTSCSDDDEDNLAGSIVGSWADDDESGIVTFNSDGSYIAQRGSGNYWEGEHGDWKIENGHLVLSCDEYYKIETLTNDLLVMCYIDEDGDYSDYISFHRLPDDYDIPEVDSWYN